MLERDNRVAGESRGPGCEKCRKPYQAPRLGRIDLEADRVLGFCHSGNPTVLLGGCDIPSPVCAIGS